MTRTISFSISDDAGEKWDAWKKMIGKNQTDAFNALMAVAPLEQMAKKVMREEDAK